MNRGSNTPDDLRALEVAHELAYARLGVAEDLRWLVMLPVLLLPPAAGYSWLWGAVAGLFVLYLVRAPYAKAEAAAEDRYYRAAGLGKYFNSAAS